ncbi:DUF4957 domain-containing protein [Porphyromonadaceae sp. NP-X]|jgi:hypothetical protein|nr:DUF4957 domain-containing protein [Porphyromonadaceae sp. NP-X]NLJ20669.1 DUF4957 domain-containing protein [Bacteroidales bacterium]
MKTIFRNILFLLSLLIALTVSSCKDDLPEEITELITDRLFSPVGVEAKVINKTQVVLNWTKNSKAETYVIEVYENDSLTFTGTPVMTFNITNDDIPDTIKSGLIGATQYSVRIKAVGSEITESKWSAVYFKTGEEQIMNAVSEASVSAHSATLTWKAGETATKIILTGGQSTVEHLVTADEIAAGEATVSGLNEDTDYSAKLMKDDKIRGTATFTTKIDLSAENTVVVHPEEDLVAAIQAAASGSRIVLVASDAGNEFLKSAGQSIDIDKSISIRGYLKSNKPILHMQFRITAENASLTVKDVILNGQSDADMRDHLVQLTQSVACGDILFKDCIITNYNKSLISGASGIAVSVKSFTMQNCKVSNILTNSADCIDVRSGCIENATLLNSTFYNCAPARDFFRLDDAASSFPDKTTFITVNRCTFSKVSNDVARRLLYVRFANNQISFTNNVVANSVGYYTNQTVTNVTFNKNNYYNAPNYLVYTGTALNVKTDDSGTYLQQNPGFVDEANGDLTITNAALLEQGIGANISW